MRVNFRKKLIVLFATILFCTTLLFVSACNDEELEISTKVEQVEDKQLVKVSWDCAESVDEIVITLKHGDEVYKTLNVNSAEGLTLNEQLREEKNSVVIETFYGKHTVEVVAKKGDRVSEVKTNNVNVFTDEYNIAPLVATVPVTIYTLGMKNYTNNFEIPTFFWLERSNAWDYEQLLDNVYPIPTATKEEITTEYNQNRDAKTIAWVKELYEMNNNSKFNFFCNDYWPTVWLDVVYGNDIPVENFKITLLSDGTASYKMFNDVYNNQNAAQTYENYVTLWENYKNGTVDSLSVEQCRALVYVWVQDPTIDLTWVINRIDTIGQDNISVKNKITELYNNNTGRIRRYYLDQLWNALSETEKNQIKKLYQIGDVFASSEQSQKTPMVILGTSTSGEGTDLEAFLTLIMNIYGNEYEYYYKGHPMYPTNANPTKQALLENLGVHELESSIPAEFFYYFYPNVAYSGYGSSTFANVGDEPSKAVFTKYESCDAVYKDHLEVFISKLNYTDSVYGSLISASDTNKYLIQDKSNLVEGVFTKIVIYDSITKTFVAYNYVEGNYVKAN